MVKKPESHCVDCKKRYVGCHDRGDDYQQFRKELKAYLEERRAVRSNDLMAEHRPWFYKYKGQR